jgi:alpha/beta superfamily hydrolase
MHIVFSHGKDGEPWGAKITAMAEVARKHGLAVESVDYRGMDEPAARVERLLGVCRRIAAPVYLVGSSLGGHVAAAVSTQAPTLGMYLLAPAFYMPGYERYTPAPAACPVTIVHGWNDDVVPVENSIRYAQQYKAALHILDSDHRLSANLEEVCELLDGFLSRSLAARSAQR